VSAGLFPQYRPQAEKSRFERLLQAFAQTRPGGKLFLTVLPAVDRRLLRVGGGRFSTGSGQPYLLLHTRGARSGLERTTPLLATQAGDTLLIVASRAGDVRHPGWLHNLRANPDVEITVRGRRHPMRAEVVEGDERESLWTIVCDNYSGYATYQRRAPGRFIPLVALTPRDPRARPLGAGGARPR
jgi:deazaflavin-dependent oxidoreductase (nitroreductase family)